MALTERLRVARHPLDILDGSTLNSEQILMYHKLVYTVDIECTREYKVERLSDLSRKNTGLSYQYISPPELAKKVLAVASPACPAKIRVQLEENCPDAWLYGNETQLSQLLLNLVLNGFHAMQETGGTLTLAVSAQEEHILLQVTDTGAGFDTEAPMDEKKHVGLRNIRGRLKAMVNGELLLESTPGVGTKAVIMIPKEATE